MTPDQRRKNRNTAIGLVVVIVGIFAWAFWRALHGGLGG